MFGWGHYAPSETGDYAVIWVIWAGVFGLLMADLTARSGTLGPAVAVHFVNNLSAFLFVSLPDDLSGLALYTLPYGLDDDRMSVLLYVDFVFIIVMWLAARLVIRR